MTADDARAELKVVFQERRRLLEDRRPIAEVDEHWRTRVGPLLDVLRQECEREALHWRARR